MSFLLVEALRVTSGAGDGAVHALPDEHLSIGQEHDLRRGERLQDGAHSPPARARVGELHHFDGAGRIARTILSGNHEPLVRRRLAVLVDLDEARGRAAVRPELQALVQERPVIGRRDVPVRVLHGADDIQTPGIAIGKGGRASADAEPGASELTLALCVAIARRRSDLIIDSAVVDFSVVGAHLPVVLPRSGLDDLHLRIEGECHPGVFQRDVPIGHRIVDFRHHDVHATRREGGVALALVVAAFFNPERIRRNGAVLIEAAEDEHPAIREWGCRRVPACVLLI